MEESRSAAPTQPGDGDGIHAFERTVALGAGQISALCAALEAAFTIDDLRSLLATELEGSLSLRLDVVVPVAGRNLHDICSDLVLWALHDERVKLQGLLAAALRTNPTNPLLLDLQKKWAGITFASPPCPYPGMRPFTVDDRTRFYGRHSEVQQAVDALRRHPFLAVIGPSGSGKSSLLVAGILPALERSHHFAGKRWTVRSMRPGATPFDTLASLLGLRAPDAAPASAPGGADWTLPSVEADACLLLVVDQYEELYTVAEERQRDPFEQMLLRFASVPDCFLLLAARADFYAQLMSSPLWEEIRAHRLEITPPRGDALRAAIALPARDVGVQIEPQLIERLLADAGEEPGVLPFIQETLVMLWVRADRFTVGLDAYAELVGNRSEHSGLHVALANHAEHVYWDVLVNEAERSAAQRILLRLVQFGEGRPDTRRQQTVEYLCKGSRDAGVFEHVLATLTANRLLTLSDEAQKVDLSHEALLGGWPLLRERIEQYGAAEQTRRKLEGRASQLLRLRNDYGHGGLLDPLELVEAEAWVSSPDAVELGVSDELAGLVVDSRRAVDRVEQEKQQAAARRRRRNQGLAAAAALALPLAALAAVFLLINPRSAEDQALERAVLAGGLAVKSASLLDQPQVALLLAVQAAAIQRASGEQVAPAVEQVLQFVLGATGGTVIRLAEGVDASAVALSADDKLAVGDASGTVRVWDLADENSSLPPLLGHEGAVLFLDFAPDGRTLVSLDDSGAVRLWDMADRTLEATVLDSGDEQVWAVALFSDTLATAGPAGRVRLWNLTQPEQPVREWEDPGGLPTHAVFARDGRYLVTAGNDYDDGSVRLWDLATAPPISHTISSPGVHVEGLAASPRTDQIAVGRQDGTITLYDLPGLEATAELHGLQDRVTSVAFLHDGSGLRLAATYEGDNSIRLWDVENPYAEPVLLRGHNDEIRLLAAGPKNSLVTADAGGEARVWEGHSLTYEPQTLVGGQGPVVDLALAPDGDALAAVHYAGNPQTYVLDLPNGKSVEAVGDGWAGDVTAVAFGANKGVLLLSTVEGALGAWNAGARTPLWTRTAHDARINDIAVEREKGWAATASDDGTVRTWNLQNGENLATLSPATPSLLVDVAFSPGGAMLAAADLYGVIHLWNLDSGEEIVPPMGSVRAGGYTSLSFSRDGSEMAATNEDGSIWRWDLASGAALPSPPLDEAAYAVAYDGRHLITGHENGAIYLWYLDDMSTPPVVLEGHTAGVNELIVDPQNEAHLFSASDDGRVLRWDLAVEALMEKACRGAGRGLSQVEAKLYLSEHELESALPDPCAKAITRPK